MQFLPRAAGSRRISNGGKTELSPAGHYRWCPLSVCFGSIASCRFLKRGFRRLTRDLKSTLQTLLQVLEALEYLQNDAIPGEARPVPPSSLCPMRVFPRYTPGNFARRDIRSTRRFAWQMISCRRPSCNREPGAFPDEHEITMFCWRHLPWGSLI